MQEIQCEAHGRDDTPVTVETEDFTISGLVLMLSKILIDYLINRSLISQP